LATHLSREAIRILLSQGGRGPVSRILRLLATFTSANGAALVEVRGRRTELFIAVELAQPLVDALDHAWSNEREQLLAGSSVKRKGHVIVPLLRAGSLVGLLALDSPDPSTVSEGVSALGPFLLDAIEVAKENEKSAPGTELRRLLEEHEWNLARVARILGVARLTIYERMRRYGIPRVRVARRRA
jgi:transcriptional regulator of acetoin/glycerol metabolism